jgi:hypothetical protein
LAKKYRGNRFEVDWSLSAKFEDLETPAARVINVSAGGLCIACPLPLREGDAVQVRILDHWGEEIRATIGIIWSRALCSGETIFGCRFIELADADRRILNALLCELLQRQIEGVADGKKWIAEDGSRVDRDPLMAQRAA